MKVHVEAMLYVTLNRNALRVLKALNKAWMPVHALEGLLNMKRGTIHYYVNKLEKLGLIECVKVSKKKFCKQTELGAKIIEIIQRKANKI